MAVYCIFQRAGMDFFHWSNSPYRVVGTLSNPNYLGAYLMITAVFSLGLAFEGHFLHKKNRIIFFCLFLLQAVTVFLSNSIGAILGLILGIILLSTQFWEVKPGKILRISPFLSGAIVAIVFTLMQAIIFYSTSNYPWENLAKPPHKYRSVVSRLMLWQMGFSAFLTSPVIGLGPDGVKYLMPLYRPPYGTALGLREYNDDPHSAIATLLADTGLLGFFGFSTLFCWIFGAAIRRRSKEEKGLIHDGMAAKPDTVNYEEKKEERPDIEPENACLCKRSKIRWFPALAGAVIVGLSFSAGFINLKFLYFSIPVLIIFLGINNIVSEKNNDQKPHSQLIIKSPMVALIVFIFHSTFNNNLSVLPIMALVVVISGFLIANSLCDVVWKKKFSFMSIPYLCLPLVYVFTAYNLQAAYQTEQFKLYEGNLMLEKGKFAESQQSFEAALKANPQSLKAYYGLAIALRKQNLLADAQDIFEKLDSMIPNIFNTNYELGRILLERKHILEAHKYALKSLEWSNSPKSYELLGQILIAEGKVQEAKKIFEEGLLLVPEAEKLEILAADRIRLNLAAIAANMGDYSTCENYINQIKTSVAQSSQALYLRGMIYSQQQRYEEALELFEKALALSPENPRIMNAVGFLLVKTNKDPERAQKLLETAYQLLKYSENPMLSDMLNIAHSLGTLYWKLGKTTQAEQLLELAWEQSPNTWPSLKTARFNDLKKFYEETGKSDALRELFAKVASETIRTNEKSDKPETH
ncbi:MAG: hypothetical protein Kow0029_10380 [Candidatus Rifleibacteriota bacterium]